MEDILDSQTILDSKKGDESTPSDDTILEPTEETPLGIETNESLKDAENPSDLPLPLAGNLQIPHSTIEASPAPPLQLLDNDSETIDDDSVFGGELSEMPEQILAETSKSNEITPNIEEELRQFEGSEDETSQNKEGSERIENLVDALCGSESSKQGHEPDDKVDETGQVLATFLVTENLSSDAFEQVDLNSMEKEKCQNIEDSDALSDDRTQNTTPAESQLKETRGDESMEAESSQSAMDVDDQHSPQKPTDEDLTEHGEGEVIESENEKSVECEDVGHNEEKSTEREKSPESRNHESEGDPNESTDKSLVDDSIQNAGELENKETEDKTNVDSSTNLTLNAEDGEDVEMAETEQDQSKCTDSAREDANNSDNDAEDLTNEPPELNAFEQLKNSEAHKESNPSTNENDNQDQQPRSRRRLSRKSESEATISKTLEKRVTRRGISNSPVDALSENSKKKDVSTPKPSRTRGKFMNVDGSSGRSTPDNSTASRSKSVDQTDNIDSTDIQELQIKELSENLTDEKCNRCRKVKQCQYKYMKNTNIRYLCSLKCVEGFRTTSKETYQLVGPQNSASDRSTPDNTTTKSKSGDEADEIDNIELKELQIKELSNNLTDEKCNRCRKVKPCKYKYMKNTNIRYLCSLKCVDGFRTTSRETYYLIARRIVVTLCFDSKNLCQNCNLIKLCRYRFKDTETDTVQYLCEANCYDEFVGLNVEKYFRRRKTYLVQEIESGDATEKNCVHCALEKSCVYSFKDDEDAVYYICSDDCFNLLAKEENDRFKLKRRSVRVRDLGAPVIASVASEPKLVARSEQEAEAARLDREASFVRRCAECLVICQPGQQMLEWETVHFCNDICLEKYQLVIGSKCVSCNRSVPSNSLGKYCVRFGFDIRQFCCSVCLDTFKKGLKVCSFCQKDISHDKDGFLAPVGDKSQFKDFCSQACMKNYDELLNPRKKQNTASCAVCNIDRVVRVEIVLDNKDYEFCSNPCFSAFKFVNNISPDECTMCLKYFERKSAVAFTLYEDAKPKVFCRKICMNIFIILNRKIVSCRWCNVKKYNFDMIQKKRSGHIIMLCSINCLRQYSSPENAAVVVRLQKICDQCHKSSTPLYNLSMSDSTLRNFCTYQCVMAFQGSFSQTGTSAKAVSSTGLKTPYPVGLPKKIKSKDDKETPVKVTQAKPSTLPLEPQPLPAPALDVAAKRGRGRGRPRVPIVPAISEVHDDPPSKKTATSLRSSSVQRDRVSTQNCQTQTTKIGKKTVGIITDEAGAPKTQLITIPQVQPVMVNKQTMCKPSAEMLAQQARRPTCTVECQTDDSLQRKFLIPVPVPIYVPQPMYMYSLPFPVPVPFPLPIPVPIFIPTTRNSAEGIMKEIKKIQDKMPSDPFEAELLMMAEMVAGEKKRNDSDSEPDDDQDAEEMTTVVEYAPDVETTSNFGEDVLQMALKMATEYEEPAVDLESAMQTNTITQQATPSHMEEVIDEDIHNQHMILIAPQRQLTSGVRSPRKRTLSPNGGMAHNSRLSTTPPQKRPRQQSIISPSNTESPLRASAEPVEKPDANMCLKYTFGVNAWKQWVMTKNSDLEKSSIRRKPFKSELLQLTADELNYSLCLFVKEVRKPNGSEYAPDTIYYLVLGIQQYLYENGRIDNIFTDPYYERFTDCLDEVARRFSVLYNDSQYIVTRVEEEHLWECKQLGAHSPHVLLSTLMFFNTKHFNLTSVDEHMQLSFSHIMKHWKRSPPGTKTQGSRNVLLRFYPPQTGPDANPRKKKVYEQQENENDPLRCPVKLYEFYLSKCPESVKTRSDVFYLQPERSCVPDSPVWYSTQPLSRDALIKMLHRVKMVKEINIALLSS